MDLPVSDWIMFEGPIRRRRACPAVRLSCNRLAFGHFSRRQFITLLGGAMAE